MKFPGNNSSPTSSRPDNPQQDIGLHEDITALPSQSGDASYPINKLAAHQRNIPHQAISIFVFHQDRLLLQQRALTKYHSGGLWANTVCSHPRWQESPPDCAQRRLQEELGWQTVLHPCGEIRYEAQVGELFENEHVYCFFGHLQQPTADTVADFLNPLEVAAVRWATLDETVNDIQRQPEIYSPWFRIYMHQHRTMLDRILAADYQLAEIEQYSGSART